MENGTIIGRGRTSEVLAWKGNRALKLFSSYCPVSLVEHEERLAKMVYDKGLPVPWVEGIVEANGRNGIVYERIQGVTMLKELCLRPWKAAGYAKLLAELHTTIHRKAVAGFPSLKHNLANTIENTASLPEHKKKAVLRLLNRLPDKYMLCHGDFHPGNVLLSPEKPYIIDWITATQGDPLADAARTFLILDIGQPPSSTPGWKAFNSVRRLFRNLYIKRYLQLNSHASMEEINKWIIPVAAGRLNENIPGESKQLMEIIDAGLKAYC